MKVLHINGVAHQGSTGKLIDEINKFLAKECVDYSICYGIGAKVSDGYKFCYRYEQALYRRISMLTGYRYGFAPIATFRLIKYIKKYNPDIVHLHSINGNCVNIYKLLEFLKKSGVPTIITNHAEFYYTGNCTSTYGCDTYKIGCINCPNKKWATDNALIPKTNQSWKKMKKAFKNFHNIYMVSVSEYIKNCAEASPITKDLNHVKILNGVDIDIFRRTYTVDIYTKYSIEKHKKICLFVTSAFSIKKDHLKGGYWLLKLANSMKDKGYYFIVVGNSENLEYHYDNVLFLGTINNKKLLANIYSQANVSLSLSRSESFGMTCVESLCCGTPVVGFKCGGMESIALQKYSKFCDYGDIHSIEKNIIELCVLKEGRENEIAIASRSTYSNINMAKKYYALYQEVKENDKDN